MSNNPKKRVVFFIDGLNLYHSLPICDGVRQYRWLDLRCLAECFYNPLRIEQIIYFTAYPDWSPLKKKRHQTFIQAQRNHGVVVEIGKFYKIKKQCRAVCKQTYWTHEEKQTDVNIAIKLLELAVRNKYDTAVLVTGDSDMVPGVKAVKRLYPDKQVHVLIPPNSRAKALKQACHAHHTIKKRHLAKSQLPNPVRLSNGKDLTCPSTWYSHCGINNGRVDGVDGAVVE